jgi:hypothetical protein
MIMKRHVPQANGLDAFVELDGNTLYVGCDGQRIGFRFPGEQKWTGVKPGYRVTGGVKDRGLYDDLIVERTTTH